MNIVVLDEGTSTGASNNIECNIIARDDTREIVLTQALTLDVKTKPDMQVVTNMEVNESDAGDGQLESAVNKVETTDETGNTEVLPDDKIDIKKNDVNVNVLPGDWQIGNTEDVEVGKPESVVQPEGTEKDWEKGNRNRRRSGRLRDGSGLHPGRQESNGCRGPAEDFSAGIPSPIPNGRMIPERRVCSAIWTVSWSMALLSSFTTMWTPYPAARISRPVWMYCW